MNRTLAEVRDQLRRVGFPNLTLEGAGERGVTLWGGQRSITCDAGALIEVLQKLPDDLGAMDDYRGEEPDAVLWRSISEAERQ